MRQAHPAADLFPLMEGEEYEALVADIQANGLLEAMWIDKSGLVLDGRNRQRACRDTGVMPRWRKYEGDDPIGFAISLNLKRRHLTTGQKAAVAFGVLPLYEAEAAKRQEEGRRKGAATTNARVPGGAPAPRPPEEPPQRAADKAAETVGTSGRSLARFKRISEQAPDLAEKVQSGFMELGRAERIIRDREAEARKVAEAQADAAAEEETTTVDLRLGDFRSELADLTDVDAIITDPPYPAEFLPLLGDLAEWADKVLAPNGVLAVLMGQTHLPDVYRLLDGHRPYRWTICYLTDGPGYVSHPRKVQSNWKPLLIYGGGPRLADVVRSEGQDADAKSNHKWGQDYSAFHTIVERLTSRGQTVADPFMGSGTTLLAARALGRNVVGCDVDPEAFSTAQERLS